MKKFLVILGFDNSKLELFYEVEAKTEVDAQIEAEKEFRHDMQYVPD